jgi:hypothetical protein
MGNGRHYHRAIELEDGKTRACSNSNFISSSSSVTPTGIAITSLFPSRLYCQCMYTSHQSSSPSPAIPAPRPPQAQPLALARLIVSQTSRALHRRIIRWYRRLFPLPSLLFRCIIASILSASRTPPAAGRTTILRWRDDLLALRCVFNGLMLDVA